MAEPDISRDIRVALRPPKTESEIQFEKDLAYLKKISVPLAERREREAIESDARETVDRLLYQYNAPHRGPAKRRTPILDRIQAFFFVWVVVCILGMVGVIIYYTHPHNALRVPQQNIANQQRQSCERQNSMNADLREHYIYAYVARSKAAKTRQDHRDANTYKVLASKIPTIDCSPDTQ